MSVASILGKAKDRQGMSMMELAIVVVAIAFIMKTVWTTYKDVRNSNITSTTKQYLTMAVAKIQSIYGGNSGTNKYATIKTDLTAETIIRLGIFPKELANGKKSLKNGWNGNITIDSSTVSGSEAGDTFSIEFTNVPDDPCVELVTFGSAWAQVDVKGTAVGTVNSTTDGIPVSGAKAITACNNNNSNTIKWHSY